MNKVMKLYDAGLTPIYRIEKTSEKCDKGYKKYRDFKHLKTKCDFKGLDDLMFLSWTYDFKEIESAEDKTYFSFNFPYSYEDCLDYSISLSNRVKEYNQSVVD